MKRLITAFEGLFTAAAQSAGGLVDTARFALENVDWQGEPSPSEPSSHAMVEAHLEAVCASSGAPGSVSNILAQALVAVTDQLPWLACDGDAKEGPDVVAFSANFTAVTIIGDGGLLPSDKVSAGLSLQGRDTYYPPHAHLAEESYWIIGGDGDWRVDAKPWFPVAAGDSIYHPPKARHAMQTNEQALLSVWLWTSDLESEVVIVRE